MEFRKNNFLNFHFDIEIFKNKIDNDKLSLRKKEINENIKKKRFLNSNHFLNLDYNFYNLINLKQYNYILEQDYYNNNLNKLINDFSQLYELLCDYKNNIEIINTLLTIKEPHEINAIILNFLLDTNDEKIFRISINLLCLLSYVSSEINNLINNSKINIIINKTFNQFKLTSYDVLRSLTIFFNNILVDNINKDDIILNTNLIQMIYQLLSNLNLNKNDDNGKIYYFNDLMELYCVLIEKMIKDNNVYEKYYKFYSESIPLLLKFLNFFSYYDNCELLEPLLYNIYLLSLKNELLLIIITNKAMITLPYFFEYLYMTSNYDELTPIILNNKCIIIIFDILINCFSIEDNDLIDNYYSIELNDIVNKIIMKYKIYNKNCSEIQYKIVFLLCNMALIKKEKSNKLFNNKIIINTIFKFYTNNNLLKVLELIQCMLKIETSEIYYLLLECKCMNIIKKGLEEKNQNDKLEIYKQCLEDLIEFFELYNKKFYDNEQKLLINEIKNNDIDSMINILNNEYDDEDLINKIETFNNEIKKICN